MLTLLTFNGKSLIDIIRIQGNLETVWIYSARCGSLCRHLLHSQQNFTDVKTTNSVAYTTQRALLTCSHCPGTVTVRWNIFTKNCKFTCSPGYLDLETGSTGERFNLDVSIRRHLNCQKRSYLSFFIHVLVHLFLLTVSSAGLYFQNNRANDCALIYCSDQDSQLPFLQPQSLLTKTRSVRGGRRLGYMLC